MNSEIAQRYAQGLFELTKEDGTIEQTRKQVELLVQSIKENPEIVSFCRAVTITKEEKKRFIERVYSSFCSKDVIHFLQLIIDKGRNFYLMEILNDYLLLVQEALGITQCTVISARALTEEQLQDIRQALAHKMQKTVIINNEIDETVMAGIKVLMDGKIMDMTLRTKMDTMRQTLLKGAHL